MIHQYKMRISYVNDGILYASSETKTGHYIIEQDNSIDNFLNINIKTSAKLEQIKFTLEYNYNFSDEERVFLNGYQSWTDCPELSKNDKLNNLNFWGKHLSNIAHFSSYGDYDFTLYSSKPGFFHGFSYAYIRKGNLVKLFGSMKEQTGFTVFYFDMNNNKIIIEKDLEGLTLSSEKSYELMNIGFFAGEYDEVFDKYFANLNVPKPRFRKKTGYTSWYNYYQNINENIIKRDLVNLAKSKNKLDIFQVDDGFQTAVGDWLSIDQAKFPTGMKAVVEDIHGKDMLAGLWLAPFNAQKNSKLVHEHKDWFIKNDKDDLQSAGNNWGGFYTLNFYLPEVREYLTNVFNTVLDEWGFDMVKLDFLYSVCIRPFNGKTRGEIMHDAMVFIRKLCKLKLILGCGVPLFSSFGIVDFCRTGCDVGLRWNIPSIASTHREGVSTQYSIINTIFRRHLDGRAFCNDPDVYILRSTNNKFTLEQRALLAKINKLFGNLLFVSDDIATYNNDELAIFNDTTSPCEKKIISAEYISSDIIEIKYIENNESKTLSFNIKTGVVITGSLI